MTRTVFFDAIAFSSRTAKMTLPTPQTAKNESQNLTEQAASAIRAGR
jgi:hypothetical protein